jgi:elongation factor P hydroxylase
VRNSQSQLSSEEIVKLDQPASKTIDKWQSTRLETLFSMCFEQAFSTILKGGAHEPLYMPAVEPEHQHVIFYRYDYFSSALHEVAHWCLAGAQRRLTEDYGYWYEPDGRNAAQQLAFQKVEIKPQAIEMAFSIACSKPFSVSVDNLGESCEQRQADNKAAFEEAVNGQYREFLEKGFPSRAAIFIKALNEAFSTNKPITVN